MLSTILESHGVGPEELELAFSDPDLSRFRRPDRIPDMDAAALAVRDAIRDSSILIYGDYDADGVSSVAVLTRYLRARGTRVRTQLASRATGYGFQAAVVQDEDLVIICDCGTSDEEEIRRVPSRVVVIDHHTVPRDPATHPAEFLINPKRSDSAHPFSGLCSAALAWVLTWRVGLLRGEDPDLSLLQLAAVAQVADAAPLRWEGRLLTRLGFASARRRLDPALKSILEAAGERRLDARTAGWVVGPRLNAPGRMGDPELALQALLESSPMARPDIVARLEEVNRKRKVASDRALADALESVRILPNAIYASGPWRAGVSGIVAGKLAERYRQPAFVASVGPDGGTGSARGFGGRSVYEALEACDSVLTRWGGHQEAAGFSFPTEREDALIQALSDWRPADIAPVSPPPRLELDRDPRLAHNTIRRFRPFGIGFAAPEFETRGRVVRARTIGREGDHLEITLLTRFGEVRILGWGMAERLPKAGTDITVVGEIKKSEWMGRVRYEIVASSVEVGVHKNDLDTSLESADRVV